MTNDNVSIPSTEGSYVLVLYYSQHGTTKEMAYAIAQGIEEAGMTARIRTVPTVAVETTVAKPAIPEYGRLNEAFLGQYRDLMVGW